MPRITVQGSDYEIELVVFDKDGTLIDFDHIWGTRARTGLAALANNAGNAPSLERSLYHTMGYDTHNERAIIDGPLTVTSASKLYTIAATVLYQHGIGWERAERLVMESFMPPMSALPTPEQILPLGDVASLFQALKGAGIKIAIATSDDRAITLPTLAILEVNRLVDAVVCGDDEIPNKPAPEAILQMCEQLSVAPDKVMIVGDTISDMVFGRNAAVACCVGISGANGDTAKFSGFAHQVVSDIGQIRVGRRQQSF